MTQPAASDSTSEPTPLQRQTPEATALGALKALSSCFDDDGTLLAPPDQVRRHAADLLRAVGADDIRTAQ